MLIKLLILLIGILQIYFFILESYLYTKERGRKVFKLTAYSHKMLLGYASVIGLNQVFHAG